MLGGTAPGVISGGGGSAAYPSDLIRCGRCGFAGCDVRVMGCNCSLHARCFQVPLPHGSCPQCRRPQSSSNSAGIDLVPMSFREIDDARRAAAVAASAMSNGGLGRGGQRAKKRPKTEASAAAVAGGGAGGSGVGGDDQAQQQGDDSALAVEQGGISEEWRTGRWTNEEMAYCDALVVKFTEGRLPLPDGMKLNDFLANMLKSKQSRLTKKMKNAKLSSKSFARTTGFLADPNEARHFSGLEDAFFQSIACHQERAEMHFHMQKEWREMFSSYCVALNQPLGANAWLSSIEELDRRNSLAKDAARIARRKMMMGHALQRDTMNPDAGVIIDKTAGGGSGSVMSGGHTVGEASTTGRRYAASPSSTDGKGHRQTQQHTAPGSPKLGDGGNAAGRSTRAYASPFLARVVAYMHRHSVPFEHVDAWVPSFVPEAEKKGGGGPNEAPTSAAACRLCFAGSATADSAPGLDPRGVSQLLEHEAQEALLAFGDYSQKFSFDVGCGLPGRVYQSGVPTWEQSVQNAPHQHFERCGGAQQWGIKTVVGLPIPSPNVGRIVIVLYSRYDREKDLDLVIRLNEEFTRLLPSPKWKLVVDIGQPPPAPAPAQGGGNVVTGGQQQQQQQTAAAAADSSSSDLKTRTAEIAALLGEHMPSNPASPHASYISNFMSLRLLLLKPTRTNAENDVVRTLLGSYSSYSGGGRSRGDIAVMLARDFAYLTQPQQQGPPSSQHHHHQLAAPPPASQPQQHQQRHQSQPQSLVGHQQQHLNLHTSAPVAVNPGGSAMMGGGVANVHSSPAMNSLGVLSVQQQFVRHQPPQQTHGSAGQAPAPTPGSVSGGGGAPAGVQSSADFLSPEQLQQLQHFSGFT